jgi:2-polyprenyl-6-methoxyphenol hydroxylase-like FAD-dependent oxidoreductase
MTRQRHAEIAGAGFGGLVAALALARRGWSVRVHERDAQLRSEGFGIAIHRNGIRVLDALGVLQDMRPGSLRISYLETRDRNGAPTGRVHPKDTWRMSRQNMVEVLARHARAAGVEIVTGNPVAGAAADGVLTLQDGTRFDADLVIGADGINSPVRDALGLLRRDRLLRDGAFRMVIPRAVDEPLFGPEEAAPAFETWSGRRRVIYNPCSPEEIYVAMTALNDDAPAVSAPIDVDTWAASFPHLRPLFRRIRDDADWSRIRWSPFRVIETHAWSRGRAALLGDAANAMPPNLGQGGGCAMMNALSLAHFVADAADIPAALRAWERSERPLTEHTQRLSRFYSAATNWPPVLRSLVFASTARISVLRKAYQRTANHMPIGADHV